jgi:uncharacterized protein YceK
MTKILLNLMGISCLVLILTGCGSLIQESQPSVKQPAGQAEASRLVPLEKEETSVKMVEIGKPERAGETTSPAILSDVPQPINELADGEYRWNQLLGRDAIAPFYENEIEFVEASNAPYDDDELVIGVEINGEAKAYAIGPLNSREMVNDTVGGVPILVTW